MNDAPDTPERTSAAEPSLSDAMADAVVASRQVFADRLELLRLQVKDDARRFLVVTAYGTVGVVCVAFGVVAAAREVAAVVTAWLSLDRATGPFAVLMLIGGAVLLEVARRRLPSRTVEVRAPALPSPKGAMPEITEDRR